MLAFEKIEDELGHSKQRVGLERIAFNLPDCLNHPARPTVDTPS